MDDIARIMERVDVVIACTGAGRALVTRADLGPVMRKRRMRSIVMIDLSVPRNIDPDVNQLDGVYRFDVDDLRQVADVGVEKRKVAAVEAERIVTEEAVRAWRQLQVDGLLTRVGGIARRAESIRAAELERAGLSGLDPKHQKAVDAMSRAIVKKVLHPALAQARALAEAGEVDRLEALLATLGEDAEGT
jgi:glutamyl-tRNA reductase